MADVRPSGVRQCRRWTFEGCVFDEANWTLTVNGARVPIESKPLKILRELLLRPHEVVSKEELLDAIWPEVTVVEASLTTAVRKLRIALGDGDNRRELIETVPGIGYRFAGNAVVSDIGPGSLALAGPMAVPASAKERTFRWAPIGVPAIAGALALVLGGALLISKTAQDPSAASTPHIYSDAEARSVLRTLDVHAVEGMIAAGWKPSRIFDKAGSTPLTYVLEICEWNPGHDRQRLMMVARVLIENGALIAARNVFGDTAYSIAKAPRYCGPDHPATRMIRAMCAGGDNAPRDRCMASYELARGQHFQPESQYKRPAS
jgi:DNA-binding winged helix-turn-helix (wHTH) protein